MELRILRYFLAVCEAGSICEAANDLHITQPTLSRQLMDLEKELGVKLINRGRRNQRITLTEEGIFLRKHAQELVTLADKTEKAFRSTGSDVAGDVYICASETDGLRPILQAANCLQESHPHIHYHVFSGDGAVVEEHLDKGLADFGVLLGTVNGTRYDSLTLPARDTWAVLMRRDSPLAKKEVISPEDLWDKPLILNRQGVGSELLLQLLKRPSAELNIVATYTLAFNASLMTAEGLGYTLLLDRIVHTAGSNNLCSRPLDCKMEIPVFLAWKKHQSFSTAARLFLETVRQKISNDHK